MHGQVEITIEDDVVRARFSGVIGKDLLPQAAKTFEELSIACAAHGCSANDTYGAAAGPLIALTHNGLPEELTTGLAALAVLG